MVIYVDMLILLNLFINFYLLMFSAKLSSEKPKFLRMLAAAFLGSAAAFIIFLPDKGFILSALSRLIISGVVVLVCFGFGNRKRFLRLLATFFTATFAFAGVMMALWYMLNVKSMAIRNGVVYFDISPILLIVSTVVAYLILTLIRKLTRKNITTQNDTYSVIVSMNGVQSKFSAFLDTGNSLVDVFTDDPVIVAEYSLISELLPIASRETFLNGNGLEVPKGIENRFRVLPYSVVGSSGLLPGFRPDYVEICAPGFGRTENVVIAVSKSPLGGEHRALIGSDLLTHCSGKKATSFNLEDEISKTNINPTKRYKIFK